MKVEKKQLQFLSNQKYRSGNTKYFFKLNNNYIFIIKYILLDSYF